MDQYEFIRIGHRVYGKSIKQLIRETGHSRNTIRKALHNEYLGYTGRERQSNPVLGRYHDQIETWLEADKDSPKKQRHTAKRVFDRLVEEHGFEGSESNVRRYVREAKRRLGVGKPKAFIPLDPESAKEGEVDWGNAVAIIGGQRTRIHVFCMRSKFSGKPFVRAYPCERQQILIDGHMHAFEFYGGVFKTLIYDNLTTAVKKVLRGKQRIEQDSFNRFRSYYNFESRFCNLDSAHEKGGVEGMVGFARRNFMVPLPEAESLEDLNRRLLDQCQSYGSHRISGRNKAVNAYFEEEKSSLIPLPANPFNNIQATGGKIDHYSTVVIDRNRYSVPCVYSGLKVEVELTGTTVRIYHGNKRIGSHERVFGSNKWVLDPDHYLDLIQERPFAFHAARAIREWRIQWPESLETLLDRFTRYQGETDGIKDFISVLMFYRDHGSMEVNSAVESAVARNISSSEGVKYILLNTQPDLPFEPLADWPVTQPADVSQYAVLGNVS
jgi:transposase